MTASPVVEAPARGATWPVWGQPGITDVAAAREFLAVLRSRDTLLFPSFDGDVGQRVTAHDHLLRGHCASVSASIVAASPPPSDLVAYHRALGFGPERVYCPTAISAQTRLAAGVLEDARLVETIRADRTLTRAVVAFKDRSATELLDRLGLAPAYCAPSAQAYETANDKLHFARAGSAYGFETLPVEPVDRQSIDGAFRSLAQHFGDGCIVRLSRGAGGNDVHHVRSPRAARRIFSQLAPRGQVLIMPFVPPGRVARNVATHGIVTDDGFAPLVFSEQRLRGPHFRGGRVAADWSAEEIAVISRSLAAIARWLHGLGYVNAPAGIDGFLLRDGGRLRFLALDPNVRLTGTTLPWAAAAVLSETAGRGFVWQAEQFYLAGVPLSFAWLARRLGADLLDPARPDRGGIVPSSISPARFGRFGVSALAVISLGHDAEHLARLRTRLQRLAPIVR
jgi:hypothetical protein